MKTIGNVKIIGVDAGYGNMKTANFCFPTGLAVFDSEPIFNSGMLIYNDRYYLIGEGHRRFLFAVNDSLRKTLQEMFGAAILGTPTLKNPNAIPVHGSKQQEQSGEMADDFLKNFL